VRGQPLRRIGLFAGVGWALILLAAPVSLVGGCLAVRQDAPPEVPPEVPPDEDLLELGRRYLADPDYRRAVLEGALVNPANRYSELRLLRYDEETWGAMPEWKPELAPEVEWTMEALVEAGRAAFFSYPVQIAPALRLVADDPALAERYGVQNVVWAEIPDGRETAFTCATCHARPAGQGDGTLEAGPTNARLDYGAVLDDFYVRRTAAGLWGPGLIDVTADSIDNPTLITDLRPLRHQEYLHRTASVRNGLVELAIRTETLIITSLGQFARPPRGLVFAMALYLWSLADELPPIPETADSPGRQVFEDHCGRCHAGDGLTGAPVSLEEVATDPLVGESPARTTGSYRVPSLRGVGDRTPLLSNAGLVDLSTLLSADRKVPGHRFGLDLSSEDRSALLEFLGRL